jgi:hypothetical protein
MKKEDIEKKLDTAVSGMIPEDMFERISKEIASKDEVRVKKGINKKLNIFSRGFIGVAAAACVLFAVGFVGVPYYGNNFIPDSRVDIDVNPGVEIVTNKKNKVLDVQSTNKDGEIVIDGMDLKNTELKVAVNALIGSMVQKGYIVDNSTGILVTVRNGDPDKAQKVKEEVLDDINFALYKNDLKANVMNQTLTDTVDVSKFAKENNISIGKAVFVLNLAAKDNSLDAKELAKMKISEIAELVAKKGIDIRDIVDYDDDDSIWENISDAIEDIDEDVNENATVTKENESVYSAGTKKQISVDEAKQIALAHANLAQKDVTFVETKLDNEDNRIVYKIEFVISNIEYDYEIDAVSGKIISSDSDVEDDNKKIQIETSQQQNSADHSNKDKAKGSQEHSTAQTQAPTAAPTQPAPSKISVERAKQIAVSHAGVSGASFTKVELDTDDGIAVYDIEFKVGNTEYDYEINAASGAIISSSLEIDD